MLVKQRFGKGIVGVSTEINFFEALIISQKMKELTQFPKLSDVRCQDLIQELSIFVNKITNGCLSDMCTAENILFNPEDKSHAASEYQND